MDKMLELKIQNTINEIENQLTKDSIDPSISRLFLQRSIHQLNLLLLQIGYLEAKLDLSTFNEWLELGIKNNWCGPAICETHDGLPMTFEEEEYFFEGNDPCIHIVRLYEDKDHATKIEENHSASNWRKPYELR